MPNIIAGRLLVRKVARGQQAAGSRQEGKTRLSQLSNPEARI